MYTIGKARNCDGGEIDKILHEMDLFHGSISIGNFWVGKKGGKVVAIAQIEAVGDDFVISSVGVEPEHRRNGIASDLVSRMLGVVEGDVYLFTQIPELFARLGFEGTDPPKTVSEYRIHFDCAACKPGKCVCMKKS